MKQSLQEGAVITQTQEARSPDIFPLSGDVSTDSAPRSSNILRPPVDRIVDRHGHQLLLRPVVPGDRDEVGAFFSRLSHESRRLRFFHAVRELQPRLLDQMLEVDIERSVVLVVTASDGRRVHGVAQYVREGFESAEFAIAIADSFHGEGVGTLLLWRLADHARGAGIRRLTAVVLCENDHMLAVLRDCGFPLSVGWTGEVQVELNIAAPPKVPDWLRFPCSVQGQPPQWLQSLEAHPQRFAGLATG
jgi:GNAT superfamily N-acetyltransferase